MKSVAVDTPRCAGREVRVKRVYKPGRSSNFHEAWAGHSRQQRPACAGTLLGGTEIFLVLVSRARQIFTGCSDGLIRAVGVQPNAVLGVVGEHAEPVEVRSIR
eukprot:6208269-Pleurochrysis_carterae.AAC.3